MDSRQLPEYQCHKKVRALKIKSILSDGAGENRDTDGSAMITPEEEGFDPIYLSPGFIHKHQPQVGGYYVVYEDGYVSYSPQEPFESGYKLI